MAIERDGYDGPLTFCCDECGYLSRRKPLPFRITPKAERVNQWHHMIPLLFGWTLIISRQDYHRDPRHQQVSHD